jgi:type IV secretory pathway TrbD component
MADYYKRNNSNGLAGIVILVSTFAVAGFGLLYWLHGQGIG